MNRKSVLNAKVCIVLSELRASRSTASERMQRAHQLCKDDTTRLHNSTFCVRSALHGAL
jgi:hypothetical protein